MEINEEQRNNYTNKQWNFGNYSLAKDSCVVARQQITERFTFILRDNRLKF